MLGTALNSHSGITVLNDWGQVPEGSGILPHHADQGDYPDDLIGYIIKFQCDIPLPDYDKCIVLHRDPDDCIASWDRKVHQYREPAHHVYTANGVTPITREYLKDNKRRMLEIVKGTPQYHIHYSHITDDKDCRVIPQSRELCDFLGVDYQLLKPTVYKPTHVVMK